MKTAFIKVNIILLMVLSSNLIYGQTRRFEVVLNHEGIDHPKCIQQTADSGFIVCGSTSSLNSGSDMDGYIVKFNSAGNNVWEKNYGTTAIENLQSVLILSDGGFLMSGYANEVNGNYSPYIIRTDMNGNILLDTIYAGNDWEFINASVQYNNTYLFAGTTYRVSSNGPEAFVMNVDSLGNIIWKKTIGGSFKDEINSIDVCSNGDIILCGTTYSFGLGGADVYLVRLNNIGDTVWTKTFGNSLDDFGNSVDECTDGSIILAGSYQTPDSISQFYMVKTDSNGNFLWDFLDNRVANEGFYSVHQTSDGNLIAAGYTGNQTGGDNDYYIYRIRNDGGFIFAKTYGSIGSEICYSMVPTMDLGYAMVGETYSYGENFPNLYIIKTDTSGLASGSILYSVDELERSNNAFSLYPNPSNQSATIKLLQASLVYEKCTVSIYSINGILIKEINAIFSDRNININTSDIAAGIYMVVIKSATTISVNQLCIMH